jgi:membrane-bound lytic murein transglycosylase D
MSSTGPCFDGSRWSGALLRHLPSLAALTRAALVVGALLAPVDGSAGDEPLPRPPQLERDVQFWIRVYTQVDTNAGLLHDQYNLSVVYDTLHFGTETSESERERRVDRERDRYAQALRRIATAGEAPLSADDQRIKDLWGPEGTPARLHSAVDDIRFQLGQADRFRAGLIRSGAWETHIAEVFANLGLPTELAVLPHVESSFNPNAYSKVGAAGLWQFMRSTGRRYLRIDGAVDDRLDPFRSTEAAAQLLSYNHRVLGTWPLALTAWNHGTAGVRRAKESLGTDDIVRIVRSYSSRTFGFASRNFYVAFLAALEIDRNPEKYFGAVQRQGEARFAEVVVPAYVPVTALEHALRIDADKLRALNPALLPPVWNGQRRVPKSYRLRLPPGDTEWTSELLAQRLAPAEMFAGQRGPQRYRVEQGDTLAKLADRYGVTIDSLAHLNRLRTSAHLRPGSTISVPETPTVRVAAATVPAATAPAGAPAAASPPPAPPAPTAGPAAAAAPVPPAPAASAATGEPSSPGGAVSAEVARRESAEDAQVAAAAVAAAAAASGAPAPATASLAQPVTAKQAEAFSPALGPTVDTEQSADPFDYSVSHDGSIRVAAEETLGHYGDWLGVTAARLRTLNHLDFHAPLRIGQRVKLDLAQVTPEVFETLRREYHRELQANYFAAHRIVGTQVYIARPGDSVWTVLQHSGRPPLWLLLQYNPDLDPAALRAGMQIVIPRVEEVGNGG